MIVARVCAGLGNQLFIYAAARRLALYNGTELKLDATSAFINDHANAVFSLRFFNIDAEKASPWECFTHPGGKIRRRLAQEISEFTPFEKRHYIYENSREYDSRLLNLKGDHSIYLYGYWQSESYFKDIESVIRNDFEFICKHDLQNIEIAEQIQSCNAVCIHGRRCLLVPLQNNPIPNDPSKAISLGLDYYSAAIAKIAQEIPNPHFYCFSDYPQWFKDNLKIDYPITIVDNNSYHEKFYEDMWLMSQCKHFIMSNSTFSWWGAWLSKNPEKVVYYPKPRSPMWEGRFPSNWRCLSEFIV